MSVNDKNNGDPPFRIENNILKGKVVPIKSRYKHVGRLLFDRLKDNPDLVGQVEVATGVEDTFGDILDMSIKCALWMQKQGIKSNDITVISSQNSREIFIPCIAALFIGAIFNPWDNDSDTNMVRYYVKLVQPKVIFAGEKSAPIVLEAVKLEDHPTKVVSFGDYPGTTRFVDILKGHTESSVINFQCTDIDDPRQTALIIFTSGTTSLPKGISLTYQSLLAVLEDRLPFTIEDNVLKGRVEPIQSRYTHLGQLLFDSLKKNANLVGQVEPITGIEDTFGDILDKSIKCAIWMQGQGVKPNDIIVISSQSNREYFIPAIAALFIGAIFSPWDDEKDTNATRHYIKLLQPKVVFANKRSAPVVLEAAKLEDHQIKVVTFENCPGTTPFADILKGHTKCSVDNFQCTEINNSDHTAMIMFSSGTTGLPKGVTSTHRALLTIVESWLGPPVHTCMWYSCLFWLSGPLFNMRSIIFHKKKIIAPPFEEESACRIMEKYKVEWLLLTTTRINRLVRYNRLHEYDLSSLKTLYIAGSPMDKEAQDLVKKCFPNTEVAQLYGMAEMGNLLAAQSANYSSGSSGFVARNCEIKIIDPKTGKTLGSNQKGEVCGKSISMMSGYYKNPEATKNVIDEDGWLHTGDLGYYTEDGELFVVDRLSDLIKFKDHLVIASEVEAVLLTLPSVLEVAVIGKAHPIDGEHPLAFVSKLPDKKASKEELIDLVASKLPDHCHLRGGVIFLPSLPYTPTGKIWKMKLKEMVKTMATC